MSASNSLLARALSMQSAAVSPKEPIDVTKWQPVRRAPFYKLFLTRKDYEAYQAEEKAKEHKAAPEEKEHKEKEHKSEPIDILIRGCDGKGNAIQDLVATRWKTKLAELKSVDFTVHTGDAIYPNGPESPDDPRFAFFDKFGDEICFLTYGNHDANKHGHGLKGRKIDQAKINYYQIQSVLTNGKIDPRKVEILSRDYLIIEEMKEAGMKLVVPDCFYGFDHVRKGVEFYFADANTFGAHFIDYMTATEKPKPEHNQALYFSEKLHATDKPKIMFLHIPFDPVNKLAANPDTLVFLDPEDLKTIDKIFGEGTSKLGYGPIMKKIFEKLGILNKIKIYFVAHNHALYEFVDGEFRFVVTGGGGEKAQPQEVFSKPDNVPFYSAAEDETTPDQYGFVHSHIDTNAGCKVTNAFHHCDESVIQFSGKNRSDKADNELPEVTLFRNTVLDACAEYSRNNPYEPPAAIAQRLPTGGIFGVIRKVATEWGTPKPSLIIIEQLRRKLNCLAGKQIHSKEKEVIPLQDYINAVSKAIASIALPAATAFTVFLDKHFQEKYKISYAEFVTKNSIEPVALQSEKPSAPPEVKTPPPSLESKKSDDASPTGKASLTSKEEDNLAKKRLKDIILTACAGYSTALNALKNAQQPGLYSRLTSSLWGHGDDGIQRMINLQTYCDGKAYENTSFKDDLTFVKNALTYTRIPRPQSLLTFVKNQFKAEFDIEYDAFLNDPRLILKDKVGIELTSPWPPRSQPMSMPTPKIAQASAIPTPFLGRSPGACGMEARTPPVITPDSPLGDMVFVSPSMGRSPGLSPSRTA